MNMFHRTTLALLILFSNMDNYLFLANEGFQLIAVTAIVLAAMFIFFEGE